MGRRRTGPGWPTGAGRLPRCMPRCGRWPPSDPAIAHAHWRAVRERLFREHPQSPVPSDARASLKTDRFPHVPPLRFEVDDRAGPTPGAGRPLELHLPNSGVDTLSFARIGSHRAAVAGWSAPAVEVFWMAGYAGGLFIPFRDATNGSETYAAGRYLLDTAKGADLGGDPSRGTLIVDFNFAFQPSCAFDPRWACPLAPP